MSNYEISINPNEVDPNGTKYSGKTNKLPSGEFTQIPPDWNQNDESASDYVRNRTHYTEDGMVEILPECQPEWDDVEGSFVNSLTTIPTAGNTYTIKWNGVEYECVAQDISIMAPGAVLFGNGTAMDIPGAVDNGEPFVIVAADTEGMKACIAMPLDGTTELTLAICCNGEVIHKLDNKYLNLEWMPISKEVELLPEIDASVTEQSPDGYYYASLSGTVVDVEVGRKVIVYYNDVRYDVSVLGNDELKIVHLPIGLQTTIQFYSSRTVITNSVEGEYKVRICGFAKNKMPEEFLPESVEGVIIRSSTEGSAKKFKLTVDDSGTISATEITG